MLAYANINNLLRLSIRRKPTANADLSRVYYVQL